MHAPNISQLINETWIFGLLRTSSIRIWVLRRGVDWLIDWLICWSIQRLIDWLIFVLAVDQFNRARWVIIVWIHKKNVNRTFFAFSFQRKLVPRLHRNWVSQIFSSFFSRTIGSYGRKTYLRLCNTRGLHFKIIYYSRNLPWNSQVIFWFPAQHFMMCNFLFSNLIFFRKN